MNIPFRKKKTKAEQLDNALKELVASCAKVEKILQTVKGETKHTLNLKLCLKDAAEVANHIRSRLNKPVAPPVNTTAETDKV